MRSISYTSTIIKAFDIPYHRAFITEYSEWSKRYPDKVRWIMQECFRKAEEQNLLKGSFTYKQRGEMLWNMYMGSKIVYCTLGQSYFDENEITAQFKEWADFLIN